MVKRSSVASFSLDEFAEAFPMAAPEPVYLAAVNLLQAVA